jgi:L-asparaginase/Glu-tRNA(Gln) amidotransferase subunit D
MTLKELQRVMSPGSGTVIHLQQCLRGRHPMLFKGRGKQLAQKTMITIFFTGRQLILLDVPLKRSKFNL